MDEEIELSLFVIFIPIWILIIVLFIFVALNGLASKNNRVNKCEKIFLSLLVPTGFTLTFILVISFLEGHFESKVIFLFAPEALSFFFLYLYIRCLVKPTTSYTKVAA